MSLKRKCSVEPISYDKIRFCEKTITYPVSANFLFEEVSTDFIEDAGDLESYSYKLFDFNQISYTSVLSFEGGSSDTAIFQFSISSEEENIIGDIHFDVSFTIADYTFQLKGSCKEAGHESVEHKIFNFFDSENGYVADDKTLVKMNGHFTFVIKANETRLCFEKDGDYAQSLGQQLYARDDDDKDFSLCVADKTVKIHKSILCSSSPVFEAMMKPEYMEMHVSKVEITDFDYHVVLSAVKSCYQIPVDFATLPHKLGLLQFFDKYQMLDKKEKLEDHIIKLLKTYNVCTVANASLLSNSPKLRQACIDFLLSCVGKHGVADFDILDKEIAQSYFNETLCVKETI